MIGLGAESWHAAASAWCAEAEARSAAPAEDLGAELDFVERGIRLRRRAAEEPDRERRHAMLRALVAALFRAQNAIAERLREHPPSPGSERYATIAERLRRSLAADRAQLERAEERPVDRVARTVRLERLRGDLHWREQLAAVLESEQPPHAVFHTRAALDGAIGLLGAPAPGEPAANAARRAELAARAETLRGRALANRAAAELAAPIAEDDAGALWRRRFALTRLEAEVRHVGTPTAAALADRIRDHRAALATAAAGRLAAADAPGRAARFRDLEAAGEEAAIEIVAGLDALAPEHGFLLLEAVRDDVETLAAAAALPGAESEDERRAAAALRKLTMAQRRDVRNSLQDRRLNWRKERLLGKTLFKWFESAILYLTLGIFAAILAELFLDRIGRLTIGGRAWFAAFDLAVSAAFLTDFSLRLALVEDRARYFRRHFIVDLLAALPIGFIVFWMDVADPAAAESFQFLRFFRLLRLQAAQPLLRLSRLVLLAQRFSDRLMQRYARAFNRNIVLWEPERTEPDEDRTRLELARLRDLAARLAAEARAELRPTERLDAVDRLLRDLEVRIAQAPPGESATRVDDVALRREFPVEKVVDDLVCMTPERLQEKMGPQFAESVARYVRMFDAPLIRRLPVVRDLVALRARPPAEIAAAAANRLGRLLQAIASLGDFGADLQGTVSPPIFVDRLGTTFVNASAGPAKRVVYLAALFAAFVLFTAIIPLPDEVDQQLRRIFRPLTGFVAILGVLCFAPLLLGTWLRRIANQASDDCERLVEAQFAVQTKSAKLGRRRLDSRFLAERVVRPELALRASDDAEAGRTTPDTELLRDAFAPPPACMRVEELRFLRTIELLYGDYLDGSPFHRSDTKTANQLLGNLALANLRHGGRRPGKDERRRLSELDLAKRGGVLGGAYLWFNYINRMITQETAKLLLDYNAHAIPLERLPSADPESRERHRRWLAERSGAAPAPPPSAAPARPERTGPPPLETVEFTALDFLTENPERDREVRERFGPEVAELLMKDRRNVVRKAFKSYPLHRLPKAKRTLNVYALYFRHLSGGRFLLLPLRAAGAAARLAAQGLRSAARVVKELLQPTVTPAAIEEPDDFRVAMRKVHRMRKPAFMRSLWLRAEFDVEYLGLSLPGAPGGGGGESLIDRDLDFIGAAHAERMEAERLRERRAAEMRWLARWLAEAGLDYASLGERLPREFPFLAHRRAEAIRALATAAASDRDDVFSLGAAIAGLRLALAAGADHNHPLSEPPADLPPPVDPSRPRTHRGRRGWLRRLRWARDLFSLPCFPNYNLHQQARIRQYLRIHGAIFRPWVDLLLDQGGPDPPRELHRRFTETLQRTDVWSDQIVTLRTVQTLTILDVHHYCRTVWDLGGYQDPQGDRLAASLPFAAPIAAPSGGAPEERLTVTALE